MDLCRKVIRHRQAHSHRVLFLAQRHEICPTTPSIGGDFIMKSKPNDSGNDSKPSTKPPAEPPLAAKDHYQREKARRARHTPVDTEAMASARREYQALLEASAQKGRGGRPKKTKPPVEEVDQDTQAAEE